MSSGSLFRKLSNLKEGGENPEFIAGQSEVPVEPRLWLGSALGRSCGDWALTCGVALPAATPVSCQHGVELHDTCWCQNRLHQL